MRNVLSMASTIVTSSLAASSLLGGVATGAEMQYDAAAEWSRLPIASARALPRNRAWHAPAMKTVLIALALAACGGGQPPPPAPAAASPPGAAAIDASRLDVAAALARTSRFADDMCKCADRACVERVTEAMTRWAQDMVKAGGQEATPTMSEADTRRMAQITERLTTCVTDVMNSAGSGSLP